MASNVIEYVLKVKDEGSAAVKANTEAAKGATEATGEASEASTKYGAALLGMAAGAAAAGAALFAMMQSAADLRNELLDASTRTGIAAETLAGLRLAAEGSGLQFGQLERVMGGFTLRLQQAHQGMGEASRGFESLGVEVNDLNGELRSADQILFDTLNALSAIEDPTKRAAAAAETFGTQGTRLLQALGDPASLEHFVGLAREFGVDVGPKAAKAAEDWQRNAGELGMVLDGFKDQILTGFGSDLFADFNRSLVSVLATFTGTMTQMLAIAKKVARPLALVMAGDWEKAAKALGVSAIIVSQPGAVVRQSLADIYTFAAKELAKWDELSKKSRERRGGGGGGGGDGPPEDDKTPSSAIKFRTEVSQAKEITGGVIRVETIRAGKVIDEEPSGPIEDRTTAGERLKAVFQADEERNDFLGRIVSNTAGLAQGNIPGNTWWAAAINFLAVIGDADFDLDWGKLEQTIHDAFLGAVALVFSIDELTAAIIDGIVFGIKDAFGTGEGSSFRERQEAGQQSRAINDLSDWLESRSFQTGSKFIDRTGLAMLHKGEQVTPANGASPSSARGLGGGGLVVNINAPLGIGPGTAEQLVRELNSILGSRGLNLSVT
jgi:hypothetical protein